MVHCAQELRERTKQFGLRVVRLVQSLGQDGTSQILGKQLLRCGTSVGANYRAACRARSRAEFRSKLGIVEEECDEAIYWLELLAEANIVPATQLKNLQQEAHEILSITVASINTSKQNTTQKSLRNAPSPRQPPR